MKYSMIDKIIDFIWDRDLYDYQVEMERNVLKEMEKRGLI